MTIAPPPVAPISLPGHGLRRVLHAVSIVWRRELIAFSRSGVRLVIALVQPMLFLFVLGTGLSSITHAAGATNSGFNYRTFMYPGVLAFGVLMPSVFSAGSIVFDREFGFLREMLVAPVRRSSIVIGKCLGGATVATLQGTVIVMVAGLVHVPYDPLMIVELIAELFLLSFSLVAIGVAFAARITQFQNFMAVVQLLTFPMLFLSGALYPLKGLPGWLGALSQVDPITYAVDPLRRTVFDRLDLPPIATRLFGHGVTWGSWHVPIPIELAMVAALGLVALTIGIVQFETIE